MTEEKFNKLIETLKKDFDGDSSYMSGVNDGMYHLKRKLQELNIFAVSVSLREEASCLTCLYGNKDTNSHPCINCRDKNLWRKQ